MAVWIVVASCGGSSGTQASAEPIVGYWSWEGNGVQQIRSLGSGDFDGSIVKSATTTPCAAPVGRVVLKIEGSAKHYTGQDEWYRESDCARRFSTDAVVDLTNGSKTAHLCSTGPFTELAPVSTCVDLMRIVDYTLT